MRIYVNHLAYGTTSEKLKEIFAAYGTVSSCRIPLNRQTNIHVSYGYVVMPHDTEAKAAIKALDGKALDGKKLEVRASRQQQRPVKTVHPEIGRGRFEIPPRVQRNSRRMVATGARKSQDR